MILCNGEALIDMIPCTDSDGNPALRPHCGGAIFNTAIALGRLGIETAMFSGISSDLFGRQLSDALAASHVDTSLLAVLDHASTLAFVELQNGQAKYTFYDENSAGRLLTPQHLPTLPDTIDALYFGGISLCQEPAADAYLALAQREAPKRTIMVDPNIRPGFIADVVRYRDRLGKLLAIADIVKVSDEDLHWLLEENISLAEKARLLMPENASMVIVTQGGEGALAILHSGDEILVPAEKAEVVDTVGAGDTFNAGVLAYLTDQNALQKTRLQTIDANIASAALAFGAKVAAVTVARAGANPPWRHELP